MNVFELVGKITLDGIEKAQTNLDGLEKKLKNNEKAFKAVAVAGGAVVGVLGLISGVAIKMGMDAVESENLFEVAMGNMGKAARQWSQDLSDAVGLNEYELRKNIGTIYQMVSSMGIAEDSAFDMSSGLTQLAYDMASFYNLKPEEAFTKLTAGITGETEPLKRLGILVDENTVKTTAYANGVAKAGEELTQTQKVQARYIAIMQQTANAQGDMARTLDSPTNRLRVMKSQIEETTTKLGMAFLPVFAKVANAIAPAIAAIGDFVGENSTLVAVLIALVGSGGLLLLMIGLLPKLVAGVNSAIAGWKLLTGAQAKNVIVTVGHTAALVANKVAMVANTAVTWVGVVAKTAWNLAISSGTLILGALIAVTGLATAAQWAWNVALTANSIGVIIVGNVVSR